MREWDYLRAFVAVCCGLIAVVVGIVERHVHVVWSEPATYGSFLEHKCGLLMMVCVGWALVELMWVSFGLHWLG